jgi:hypothetical protein
MWHDVANIVWPGFWDVTKTLVFRFDLSLYLANCFFKLLSFTIITVKLLLAQLEPSQHHLC